MHEFSMAEELLNVVKTHAESKNANKVVSIKVKLSEFSLITPDALLFSFEAVTKGTIAEGAALFIERMPLIVRCKGCGTEAAINMPEDVVNKIKSVEGHEHLGFSSLNSRHIGMDCRGIKGGVEGVFNCNNCSSADFDVINCGELSLEKMELDV